LEYLVIQKNTGLIQIAYRELNGLEFLYELGEYVCFQNRNQSRCAP
jgi:hypothetical protein